MKTFDQKVKQIKSRRIITAVISLTIAVFLMILGIIQIIPREIEYVDFKKSEKSSNYAKLKILYLMGPLVEVKEKKSDDISGYYIAVGKEEQFYIVRADKDKIEAPILGKDLDITEVDKLEESEIYGIVELTSSSLRSVLNKQLNDAVLNEELLDNNSFEKVFGGYHLDTVSEPKNNWVNLFVLSAFFAVIGGLYLFINKKIRQNVNQTIDDLKAKGKLDDVIKEFEGGKLIEYKKLQVDLSPKYIFSYSNGLRVIAFKNIKDVKIFKKAFGSTDKNKYIIVTTKDNIEYYIAPTQKRRQKAIFNELLAKIKRTIE